MWCAVAGGKEWLVEVMEGVVLPVVCGWDSLMTMTQIWEPDPRPARLSAPQHPCPSRLGTARYTGLSAWATFWTLQAKSQTDSQPLLTSTLCKSWSRTCQVRSVSCMTEGRGCSDRSTSAWSADGGRYLGHWAISRSATANAFRFGFHASSLDIAVRHRPFLKEAFPG